MNRFSKFLGILVGIGVIIIGICLLSADTDSIGKWGTRFGGDFYTEIYSVTQDVGYAVNDVTKAIHKCVGWIVIVLGALTSCYYFNLFAELCDPVVGVENCCSGKNNFERNDNTVSAVASSASEAEWTCGNCQTVNSVNYGQCKKCGTFRG